MDAATYPREVDVLTQILDPTYCDLCRDKDDTHQDISTCEFPHVLIPGGLFKYKKNDVPRIQARTSDSCPSLGIRRADSIPESVRLPLQSLILGEPK